MAILKVKNGSQWVDIPSIVGPPGQEGSPGISPTVAINDISDGHRVTITDATGPHSFDVLNGADGQTGPAGKDGKDGVDGSPGTTGTPGADGTTFTPYVSAEGVISWTNNGGKPNPQPMNIKGPHGDDGTSPTVSVADIPGGHRVTVTDANGTRSFDVMDGEDYVLTADDKAEIAQQAAEDVDVPVQDVQVNGVSVVANGVANVPVASNGVVGLVRPSTTYGTNVYGVNNTLGIVLAELSQIKSGGAAYNAIPSSRAHYAAFYGLAKAAGADMASSSNPVGTYTDAAKAAIQKMLGIYEAPWELLNDITLAEEGRIDLTADANGTPYDLRGVYIRVYYAPNLIAASTGYARYLFEDSDGTTLYAETGRYTAQTSSYSKFAYILRDGLMAIAVHSRPTATSNVMAWQNKDYTGAGVKFDFKNIRRIYMNTSDVEPAGTRIQIYGQRAY